MRKHCLDCVYKHLSKACVVHSEIQLGYPDHEMLVIGNLSEAEDESLEKYPLLAREIRKHRIRYTKNPMYKIPYFELGRKVRILQLEEK